MNLVALIGNVQTEPQRKGIRSGYVCTFTVRVSNAGQIDDFEVATFDRQADVCAEYLRTGTRVGIEGRLQAGPDRVRIVATRVNILGKTSK